MTRAPAGEVAGSGMADSPVHVTHRAGPVLEIRQGVAQRSRVGLPDRV